MILEHGDAGTIALIAIAGIAFLRWLFSDD